MIADKISRTKLRMSFLQYPTLEFYSLPETTNNTGSRILLIAFSWLIAKFDVLNDIIKLRIIDSPFGKEFSQKIDKKKVRLLFFLCFQNLFYLDFFFFRLNRLTMQIYQL